MTTSNIEELIPIYVMGKRYEVPAGLTIMKALEYSGYQLKRGCGCRGGGVRSVRHNLSKERRIQVDHWFGLPDGG
jgi:hypothetical protein